MSRIHNGRRGRLAGFLIPAGQGSQYNREEHAMTTMVWINVLLAVPFIALWAGVPLWLVLRRPDTRPQPAVATPAVREMPATRVHAAYRRAA
jgi:hypothetical protein